MNAADRLDAFANTLGLIGVVLGLAYLPGDIVERRLLNERFLARDAAPPAHPDLVVVSLDDKYAARRHYPVTTSTGYVTQVVEALTAGGARVIALDIAVTDADTASAEFPELMRAVNAAPAVVLPSILAVHGVRGDRPPSFQLAAEPPTAVRALAPSGFVTFVDAAHPRMQLVARLDDRTLAASFALRAVQAHIGLLPHEADVWQRDGGSHRIAERELALLVDSLGLAADGSDPTTAAQRARLINYTGPVEPGSALAYISSEDLLAGLVLPAQLQDRLVVVGAMHRGAAEDRFDTPWGLMHGVELHANIMNSLLTRSYLAERNTGGWTRAISLAALLFVLLGTAIAVRVRHTPAAIAAAATVALAFPLLLILGAFSAFDAPDGAVLPVAVPLKVWTIAVLLCFAAAFSLGRRHVVMAGDSATEPLRRTAAPTANAPLPAPAVTRTAIDHATHSVAPPAPRTRRGAWPLLLTGAAALAALALRGRRR